MNCGGHLQQIQPNCRLLSLAGHALPQSLSSQPASQAGSRACSRRVAPPPQKLAFLPPKRFEMSRPKKYRPSRLAARCMPLAWLQGAQVGRRRAGEGSGGSTAGQYGSGTLTASFTCHCCYSDR